MILSEEIRLGNPSIQTQFPFLNFSAPSHAHLCHILEWTSMVPTHFHIEKNWQDSSSSGVVFGDNTIFALTID